MGDVLSSKAPNAPTVTWGTCCHDPLRDAGCRYHSCSCSAHGVKRTKSGGGRMSAPRVGREAIASMPPDRLYHSVPRERSLSESRTTVLERVITAKPSSVREPRLATRDVPQCAAVVRPRSEGARSRQRQIVGGAFSWDPKQCGRSARQSSAARTRRCTDLRAAVGRLTATQAADRLTREEAATAAFGRQTGGLQGYVRRPPIGLTSAFLGAIMSQTIKPLPFCRKVNEPAPGQHLRQVEGARRSAVDRALHLSSERRSSRSSERRLGRVRSDP